MDSKNSRKKSTLLLVIGAALLGLTLYSGEIILALVKSNLISIDVKEINSDSERTNRIFLINQQIKELNKNLESSEDTFLKSNEQVNGLKVIMRDLKIEESKLKARIEELKFELVDQQNKKKLFDSNKSKIEEELNLFKVENEQLKNKLEDLKLLEDEKTQLEKSLKNLEKKNEDLEDQIRLIPNKEKLLKRSEELKEKIVKLNNKLILQKKLIEEYESNQKIQLNSSVSEEISVNDDYKKLILDLKKQHKNEIEQLKNEILRTEKYKGNFDELNGIKVVFSGFMGYDLTRKEIIFMTREGQKIMMVQDNFTGTLVGECGLPVISDENETRCAATIIARLLFHKSGPIMKGLEIVEVRKK